MLYFHFLIIIFLLAGFSAMIQFKQITHLPIITIIKYIITHEWNGVESFKYRYNAMFSIGPLDESCFVVFVFVVVCCAKKVIMMAGAIPWRLLDKHVGANDEIFITVIKQITWVSCL